MSRAREWCVYLKAANSCVIQLWLD